MRVSKKDPADDGPEVDIISFFKVHKNGSSICVCLLRENYVKMLAGLR